MHLSHPTPLGMKRSFGFGDRLGLATPGHLAVAQRYDFAPIFAQQSIREMERTARTPDEVMNAAQNALAAANFTGAWGADGDHLKTKEDVRHVAASGFCFFTIDPSKYVENGADTMDAEALEGDAAQLVTDGVLAPGWTDSYLDKVFEVAGGLEFTREALLRAAVKYGRAVEHTQRMSGWIATISGERPFEIEVSVDETESPTSPLEHLFFGQELKRRHVQVVSLAPRFIGDFDKGIDFRGDIVAFERELVKHVAIAKFCGPYKISVHSGSDKFSVYPICGRICGPLLHVKTAGTSYLEALRVVVRRDFALFKEVAAYCVDRFDTDRVSYHISTTGAEVAALAARVPGSWESAYLDERIGRQLLHVTFGSVLTQGVQASGRRFKDAILEILQTYPADYEDVLGIHFDKHLRLLNQG